MQVFLEKNLSGVYLKFGVCFSPLFLNNKKKLNPFIFFQECFLKLIVLLQFKHTQCGRKDKQVELCTWSRPRDPMFEILVTNSAESLT